MNNIDRHIGSRIKLKRKALNISQYSLAYDLEISFQQLQKYESGENRVAASRLYEIAKILGTSPHFFFEGLDGISIEEKQESNPQTIKAANLMNRIKNEKIKDRIMELIMELDEGN